MMWAALFVCSLALQSIQLAAPTAVLETPTNTLSVALPPAAAYPGSALMVALLGVAAVVIVLGLVTPVPASVRERRR